MLRSLLVYTDGFRGPLLIRVVAFCFYTGKRTVAFNDKLPHDSLYDNRFYMKFEMIDCDRV